MKYNHEKVGMNFAIEFNCKDKNMTLNYYYDAKENYYFKQDGSDYVVSIDMPGIKKSELSITINKEEQNNLLSIKTQNKDLDSLRDRFNTAANGEKRDFGVAAAAKPTQVEIAVNRGTANALRCLEIASGAPLTDQEKNAKLPTEINKECPSMANPGYRPTAGL